MATEPKTSKTNPGQNPSESKAEPKPSIAPGPANTAPAEQVDDKPKSETVQRREAKAVEHREQLAGSGLPTFGRATNQPDEQPDGTPDPMVSRQKTEADDQDD